MGDIVLSLCVTITIFCIVYFDAVPPELDDNSNNQLNMHTFNEKPLKKLKWNSHFLANVLRIPLDSIILSCWCSIHPQIVYWIGNWDLKQTAHYCADFFFLLFFFSFIIIFFYFFIFFILSFLLCRLGKHGIVVYNKIRKGESQDNGMQTIAIYVLD